MTAKACEAGKRDCVSEEDAVMSSVGRSRGLLGKVWLGAGWEVEVMRSRREAVFDRLDCDESWPFQSCEQRSPATKITERALQPHHGTPLPASPCNGDDARTTRLEPVIAVMRCA